MLRRVAVLLSEVLAVLAIVIAAVAAAWPMATYFRQF